MSFYRPLIDYGLSVTKRYSVSPVVLAIIIANTTTELSDLAVYLAMVGQNLATCLILHRFLIICSSLLLIHSSLWNISLSSKSHHYNLLIEIDDKTIQLLYTIAQQIFVDGLKQIESMIMAKDLDEIRDQCTRAKSYLLEDVLDESSKKRTVDCLDKVLVRVDEPRKKQTGYVL
ncbi:hypothetical protein BD408DRAFT_432242 [Parasitella parasitica]|nr:hypothetical protein BD408DRAFT_432242 [Parasitella parasitica]